MIGGPVSKIFKYQDYLKMHFPALSKVFLKTLF